MAIIVTISRTVYGFWNKNYWAIKYLIFRKIAHFQTRINLFPASYKSIDPKELFIFQCNGLELNRPDITIQYLAVKDIVNGNIENGQGITLLKKYVMANDEILDLSLENLIHYVNSFADHKNNQKEYLVCEKNMGVLKGSQILACSIFFEEKTIHVKNTITSYDTIPTWNLLINAGFSDEEIDYIRHESDLLLENIVKNSEKETNTTVDNDAVRKWIMTESKKVYGSYRRGINLIYPVMGNMYQSLPMLGIKGSRPTDVRIKQYGLKDLLNNKMDVLDIGSNIGFMDMEIASLARSVTGIEYTPEVSKFSKRIAQKLNICNVTFINADFKEWKSLSRRQYDIILSFTVHQWIDLSPQLYVAKIASLIKPCGFVVFESRDLAEADKDYEYFDAFLNNGFTSIKKGYSTYYMDDDSEKRMWTLFQYNGYT